MSKTKSSDKKKSEKKEIIYVANQPLDEMYQSYFKEYASYVILDRAIPMIEDGLKPVQRRILYSLHELDDGKLNKVANVVGHAMRYHPHGDTSIGDALVSIGQKKLLMDTQGNWGNIFTGDGAAATRYIEARLSKMANSILFNKNLTVWQPSYDGRGKEPVILPVKFPILLAQGAQGIAVGLSTTILPHNPLELIEASIDVLNGKKFKLYPDFQTGGLADISDYNDGERGGKVKVRAKIEVLDSKTLKITEIPYGTTTVTLIESILSAHDKGKIKIKKAEDNTSKTVEILVHLNPGDDVDKAIQSLYAFTRCEESISPSACVISNGKPIFTNVSHLLRFSVERTKALLLAELKIKEAALMEKILFSSLEKIFIEEKIYRSIETCETWQEVLDVIDAKFKPYKKQFFRTITEEDITGLTEIKFKRLAKFDKKKADEMMKANSDELTLTQKQIINITQYTIDFYSSLAKEFGTDWKRKTKMQSFAVLNKTDLAKANLKIYISAKEGFIGTSLKKDEFLADCSDMDQIICFMKDGTSKVVKVADKTFVGKNILYAAIYRRGDEDTVYSMVYSDGKDGMLMVKRFSMPSIIMDKAYDLTKGTPDSVVMYFSVSKKDEKVEKIHIVHKPAPRIKKEFNSDLNDVSIKGRDSQGVILSRYATQKVSKLK